jgi:hypothetical protein
VGQGPRGRGRTGVFPFFLVVFFFFPGDGFLFFSFPPTPQQPSPSPLLHSLIGSDINFFKFSFVVGVFGGGARGKGHAQGTVGHALFCFFRLRELGVLAACLWCSFSNAHCLALLPQPHPRRSALLGPIRIETLALCRIFREGLRSSVGLLSRVWQVAWGFWACLARPLFFFLRRCSRRFSIFPPCPLP